MDPIETEIMRMNEREMEAREKGFCFASEAPIAICPHCKTRWARRGERWTAAIKRQQGCACPNWICIVCNKRIEEPADFAEYEKNGVHIECAKQELYGDYGLPVCENCGNTLTIYDDPNPITDGDAIVCGRCSKKLAVFPTDPEEGE